MTEFELDFGTDAKEFAKQFETIKVGKTTYIRKDLASAKMYDYAKQKLAEAISQPNTN